MDAKALKEKVKERLKELGEELQKGHTEGFLAFLERLGKFHAYSARNVMLIALQRPGATLVAGIKRWNEMGRRVKRGEKGIAILAPIVVRETVTDPDTGEERVEERVRGFKTVYVFDVSQTEGEPVVLGREVPGA
ncbi:MAG: hypothetical protein C4294_17385, partial [Nitrospiraceae bacterium]